MDNQQIDVTSEGVGGIAAALSIIWPSAAPGGKATHYVVAKLAANIRYCGDPTTHHFEDIVEDSEKGIETLILLWGQDHGSIPLPYPLDLGQSTEFIKGWLESLNYGPEPDHDGDNGKGWRLFTEAWGHVAHRHYAICGVQPAWAMYGK